MTEEEELKTFIKKLVESQEDLEPDFEKVYWENWRELLAD